MEKQLVVAAQNFDSDQTLSNIQITTMPRDIGEQPKLVHTTVGVVDGPTRKTYVTLLRYIVEKSKKCYAQDRLFVREK